MADTTRTFVAVAVPESVLPRVRRLQHDLEAQIPGARWVDTALHLTLAFLGDVPHADLNVVCKAMAATGAAIPPFELVLNGPGAFPDASRPRVIYAGVGGPGLDALLRLQAEVAAAAAGTGYPTERHPFHPHVTLARLKDGHGHNRGARRRAPAAPEHGLAALFARFRNWSAGPFRVSEVITFSSTLTPEGPIYAPLARGKLGARAMSG